MIRCAALAFLALATAQAASLEGIDVPAEKTVANQALKLNGAGVRVVKLGFVPIKAYVAAFYTPSPLRSEQAVAASEGPLLFNFTFLHGVGLGQVKEAWNAQFRESVSHHYPGLADDQRKFVSLFGPLKKGGIESVEIVGDETRIYDGGELKGSIKSADFRQAFLSLWFGPKPVAPV